MHRAKLQRQVRKTVPTQADIASSKGRRTIVESPPAKSPKLAIADNIAKLLYQGKRETVLAYMRTKIPDSTKPHEILELINYVFLSLNSLKAACLDELSEQELKKIHDFDADYLFLLGLFETVCSVAAPEELTYVFSLLLICAKPEADKLDLEKRKIIIENLHKKSDKDQSELHKCLKLAAHSCSKETVQMFRDLQVDFSSWENPSNHFSLDFYSLKDASVNYIDVHALKNPPKHLYLDLNGNYFFEKHNLLIDLFIGATKEKVKKRLTTIKVTPPLEFDDLFEAQFLATLKVLVEEEKLDVNDAITLKKATSEQEKTKLAGPASGREIDRIKARILEDEHKGESKSASKDVIDIKNEAILEHGHGTNALMLACINNHECAVRQLIIEYKADVNAVTSKGYTPLAYAAIHASPAIIKMLVDHGADLDVPTIDGELPIHFAKKRSDENATAVLRVFNKTILLKKLSTLRESLTEAQAEKVKEFSTFFVTLFTVNNWTNELIQAIETFLRDEFIITESTKIDVAKIKSKFSPFFNKEAKEAPSVVASSAAAVVAPIAAGPLIIASETKAAPEEMKGRWKHDKISSELRPRLELLDYILANPISNKNKAYEKAAYYRALKVTLGQVMELIRQDQTTTLYDLRAAHILRNKLCRPNGSPIDIPVENQSEHYHKAKGILVDCAHSVLVTIEDALKKTNQRAVINSNKNTAHRDDLEVKSVKELKAADRARHAYLATKDLISFAELLDGTLPSQIDPKIIEVAITDSLTMIAIAVEDFQTLDNFLESLKETHPKLVDKLHKKRIIENLKASRLFKLATEVRHAEVIGSDREETATAAFIERLKTKEMQREREANAEVVITASQVAMPDWP